MASAQVHRTVFVGRELEVARDEFSDALTGQERDGIPQDELDAFFNLSEAENGRESTPDYYKLDSPRLFESEAPSVKAPAKTSVPRPLIVAGPLAALETPSSPESPKETPQKSRVAAKKAAQDSEPKIRHRRTMRELHGSAPARKSTRVPVPVLDMPAAPTRGSKAVAKRDRGASRGGTTRGARSGTTRGGKAGTTGGAKTSTARGRGSAAGAKRGRKPGRPARNEAASGEEWEVEKIVDSQIDADSYEHFYKVKWKGYPASENTWEPKSNLTHCPDAITEHDRQKKTKT